MLYYLDASAWVKRYFQEAGSEAVDDLFGQSEALGCSPLGFIEVGSAMARKRTAGTVTADEFEAKRALLRNDWRHFLRIEMTPMIEERAFGVTDTCSLRGADSVHLASALAVREELELGSDEFVFVTSDEELKAAATKMGLSVVDPQGQAGSSPHPTA
jgi:predicted nucleic acid-binding protein